MAQGRVDIILKAVDDYSGVLTGLNQGFELTKNVLGTITSASSMAFNAVKTGAEVAYKGVAEAVNLAVKGGNYRELYEQLTNVANTFKVDADAIIADLDRITDNTISMTDSAKIAAKGIAAGFSQDELETVFTFVKRRTEATGESFEGMSEKIINAMQKGRYNTLADMGLIIEKGMDTADVFDELARATELYGQTSNSTASIIPALINQVDRFWTKIGMGIDLAPSWGSSLTAIKNAAVKFVDGLDISAVTRFTEGLTQAFGGFIERIDFDKVIAGFNTMLQALADAVDLPFVQNALDSLFDGITWAFNELMNLDLGSLFSGIWVAVEKILRPLGMVIDGIKLLNEITGFTTLLFDSVKLVVEAVYLVTLDIVQKAMAIVESLSSWMGEVSVKFPALLRDVFRDIMDFIDNARIKAMQFLGIYTAATESDSDFDITRDHLEDFYKGYADEMAKEAARSTPTITVAEMLAQANWPAEFQALGDFMFNWVLSAASGSPVPMAITTAR